VLIDKHEGKKRGVTTSSVKKWLDSKRAKEAKLKEALEEEEMLRRAEEVF